MNGFLSAIWTACREVVVAIVSRRPDFASAPQVIAETAWYSTYAPRSKGSDYGPAHRHAEREWQALLGAWDALDRKAEWTFLVAAGGAGLVLNNRLGWPALALFCLAMFVSLKCRLPCDRPTPLPPRSALDAVDREIEFEPLATASYCVAYVGLQTIADWKGRLIRAAGWLLLVAALAAGSSLPPFISW